MLIASRTTPALVFSPAQMAVRSASSVARSLGFVRENSRPTWS
jgi:hypothetical protein